MMEAKGASKNKSAAVSLQDCSVLQMHFCWLCRWAAFRPPCTRMHQNLQFALFKPYTSV